MKGLIFNVKRYSIHDGPGIRVTFFLKGCPLSCWWCHNPEGISPDMERVTYTKKVGEREFDRIEDAGKFYTADDIINILEKESIFISMSGGGVTFSGGEPLMQDVFLLSALKTCREKGYHTAIDTSGYAPAESLKRIIPYADLFLFDIKHMDDSKHREYTGVSNRLIFSNFKLVIESGKDVYIRIPVIPGFNDDQENLDKTKQFISDHKCENLKRISLLPYNRIGKAKYVRFGRTYKLNDTEEPSGERMDKLKEHFSGLEIKVQTGH